MTARSATSLGSRVANLFVAAAAISCAQSQADYYKDIQPILKEKCVTCHKAGEIGPMPLGSYAEVRPWAAAIRESVKLRKMPPWFADHRYGEFANDPRLSEAEIETIDAWAKGGARRGTPVPEPKSTSPQIARPDLLLSPPKSIKIPARAVIDYQYVILPLPFSSERWVRGIDIRPSDRSVVHHAVLYVRPRGSQWLRGVPIGVPYAPPKSDPAAVQNTRDTKEDILAIYTPGAPAARFPEGMAKRIPAGADLVLQIHYQSKDKPTSDRTEVGLHFFSGQPARQILTLQMGRDDLRIPPGDRSYRTSVSGTLPQEALLISLFPHMHLRGSAFEFDIVRSRGAVETLLRVKPYDFYWQLNYMLKTPRLLPKGTTLRWTGYFDNSPENPRNPDPAAEVTWGEQSQDEMMIGFFDVAVDPGLTKRYFFVR